MTLPPGLERALVARRPRVDLALEVALLDAPARRRPARRSARSTPRPRAPCGRSAPRRSSCRPSGSMTLATPVSSAMICCVRSAILTAFSVGSASVSSIELVCSDLRAAQHAGQRLDRPCARCCSRAAARSASTPAVCVWKRSSHERGSFAPKRVAHVPRPDAARGAELGDLLEEVEVAVEEEREPRREVVDVEAARDRRLDVLDAVGQREGQLLRRRRAGLADVVAARSRSCSTAARRAPQYSIVSMTSRMRRAPAGRCTRSARCTPSGCRSASVPRSCRRRRRPASRAVAM